MRRSRSRRPSGVSGSRRVLPRRYAGRDVLAEVIVVDGGSLDRTAIAPGLPAPAYSIRHPVERSSSRRAGARRKATSCSSCMPTRGCRPAGTPRCARALADPGVVGGAFGFRFRERRLGLAWIEWGARLRSRAGLPYGDQALFARRSALEAIGGVPQVPIVEDLDLVRALRGRGRLALLPLDARDLRAPLPRARPASAPGCATRSRSAPGGSASIARGSRAGCADERRRGPGPDDRPRPAARLRAAVDLRAAQSRRVQRRRPADARLRRELRRGADADRLRDGGGRDGARARRGVAPLRLARGRDAGARRAPLRLAHLDLQRRARDRVRAAQRSLRSPAAPAAVASSSAGAPAT